MTFSLSLILFMIITFYFCKCLSLFIFWLGPKKIIKKIFQSPGKSMVYGGFIEGNILCDPCDLLGSWFRAFVNTKKKRTRKKQINLFTIQISIHNIIKFVPFQFPYDDYVVVFNCVILRFRTRICWFMMFWIHSWWLTFLRGLLIMSISSSSFVLLLCLFLWVNKYWV